MLAAAAHLTHLRALTRLLRLPLAVMVALTAITGVLAARLPVAGLTVWAVGTGVLLLTAASSVLNQLQERASDALLRRTATRPLASGALTPGAGRSIGLCLAGGGLAVLTLGAGPGPALLGLAALTWYLVVYTPLKRISPIAVLAGTPCGAIPPLLGWLAAGGTLPAPQPLALALVLFLWQVPHYWLLALPERDELQAASFRVLPHFSDRQLLAVSLRWFLGLNLATLLLPLLDLPTAPLLQGLVAGLALGLAVAASWICQRAVFAAVAARHLRLLLHLHLALLLLGLSLDRVLTGPF